MCADACGDACSGESGDTLSLIAPKPPTLASAATLAQTAASTVWGVGPWEHDFVSLMDDPPPDEIASVMEKTCSQAIEYSRPSIR